MYARHLTRRPQSWPAVALVLITLVALPAWLGAQGAKPAAKGGAAAPQRITSTDPATGALTALVRDPAAPGPQIRAMAVGDRFGDDWRISEITDYAVTLKKGRETRVIRLYG